MPLIAHEDLYDHFALFSAWARVSEMLQPFVSPNGKLAGEWFVAEALIHSGNKAVKA